MQIQTIDEKLIKNVINNSTEHQIKFVKIAEKIIFGALSSFHQLEENERKDLAQNIFLKLYKDDKRRIKMWNGKAKFSTYLYMISTNHALDYIDSKYYRQKKLKNGNIDIDLVDSYKNKNKEETIINKITLDMCKNKLRPIEKDILELYYGEGYKEREISKKLNISINTISSIKNRALKKIRKDVMQEFWI